MHRKAVLEGQGSPQPSSQGKGAQDSPLAVGVSRVVIIAVMRRDMRIVSLVSDQMIHSGKNRSAVGHVSALACAPCTPRSSCGKWCSKKSSCSQKDGETWSEP